VDQRRRLQTTRALGRFRRIHGGCSVSPNVHNLPTAIAELMGRKVDRWLKRLGWHAQEREDLEQELVTEYLNRSAKLEAKKATSAAFISVMLDRCLASIRRHRRAKKRNACKTHGLEGGTGAALRDGQGRDARSPLAPRRERERAELALDVSWLLPRLSARQRRLAVLLMSGKSKSQAARERGVPRSTQAEKILALRARFERAGLRDYL